MATILRTQTVLTGVAGSPYYNNLYWPFTLTAEEAVAAAASFWEVVDGVVAAGVSWEVNGVVPSINSVTGEILGATITDAVTGTGEASGELLPRATQILCSVRTGVYASGREVRGRVFVPAPTIGLDDDGHVEESSRAGLQSALATWLGGLSTVPVIWSRTTGVAADWGSIAVWEEFAVLRSRRD